MKSPLQPERTEEFKKAVETIADHRDSIPLKTFLIDIASTPDSMRFCYTKANFNRTKAGTGVR